MGLPREQVLEAYDTQPGAATLSGRWKKEAAAKGTQVARTFRLKRHSHQGEPGASATGGLLRVLRSLTLPARLQDLRSLTLPARLQDLRSLTRAERWDRFF